MSSLHEKYRPKEWSEVVGQDAAVGAVRESLTQGWGGRAWWIVGQSGTGCTTIGSLIAKEQAAKDRIRYTWGTKVDAAMVRRMATDNLGLDATVVNRAYVIERPGWMPKEAMELLATVLPCLHKNICVVFTQSLGDERSMLAECALGPEMMGLSQRVELATDALEEPFAKRCKQIAEQEGLGGKPLSSYKALARRLKCNMFQMLNEVEMGSMMKERP
jgi:hypothetical protein